MKKTAYIRVSTEKQNYDRQVYKFKEYFKDHGIDPATVQFVSEKVTSHTRFTERKIYKVISDSQPGDIIYACQLDRFGRSVQDVLDLVDFAMGKGVELVTLDGHKIENHTPMGKMMLTMLAAFAEMERSLRAERCQAGYEAMRQELEKNGCRVARVSGKVQTRIGNEKGCDMSAAQEAAAKQKADALMAWKEQSVGYKWAMQKAASGMPRKDIVDEFNRLHALQPDVFCTRSGKPLSKATLCHWIADANPIAL